MIPIPLLNRKVWVYMQSVDMRCGYDSLYGLVKKFNSAPLSGDLFVFLSSDRKKTKVLLWDKNGLMIIMKRLEKGCFAKILSRGSMSTSELMLFLDGSSSVNVNLSPKDLTDRFIP
jgi:transposase